MKILIDSREQLPLRFIHPFVTGEEVVALKVGDYAVCFEDGYCPLVFFERKSISDLFGTLGKGYARFKKEMVRAQEANAKLIIIIEGGLLKVLKGYKYSTLQGISIALKLQTLKWRYGVDHVYCKNREEMSQYILLTFITLGKEYVRKKKGYKL